MHLQQRQHCRLEQLWVTLLHEEVQLVASVVPQSGKLFRVAQHAPLRKEVERTPELLLLTAVTMNCGCLSKCSLYLRQCTTHSFSCFHSTQMSLLHQTSFCTITHPSAASMVPYSDHSLLASSHRLTFDEVASVMRSVAPGIKTSAADTCVHLTWYR